MDHYDTRRDAVDLGSSLEDLSLNSTFDHATRMEAGTFRQNSLVPIPGDIGKCTCDVCGVMPAQSKCRRCNFFFCREDREFLHLCSFQESKITVHYDQPKTLTPHVHAGIGAWLARHARSSNLVWVEDLTSGGPADRSGQLHCGDIVLAVDGIPVRDIFSLSQAVEGDPGTFVSLTVAHNGAERVVTIQRDVYHAPHHSIGFDELSGPSVCTKSAATSSHQIIYHPDGHEKAASGASTPPRLLPWGSAPRTPPTATCTAASGLPVWFT